MLGRAGGENLKFWTPEIQAGSVAGESLRFLVFQFFGPGGPAPPADPSLPHALEWLMRNWQVTGDAAGEGV